ncbi:gfo/Idh/MocA family oxidoreductase [Xanthomonas arboricola pv. juglandis]|nr:gfo/Idh/MocA family oxidoreductase [Xanthomonas arboricola pv. juglandis]SYZ58805.1 gfo/Idh/MocA family oxidoreductase [Xanthomonas arboricola pv. juglandis]
MSVESITRRRLLAAFGSAGILLAAPGWALPKKKPGKPLNVALAGAVMPANSSRRAWH